MSRKGFENRDAVYAAAEEWRSKCLLGYGSMFGAGTLWSLENFRGLDRYFVQNLDEGEGTFMGKLEGQLAPAPAAVKQLAAELMWVMLLCPSNTLAPKKREIIEHVWSWSGAPFPVGAAAFLTDDVLAGIGSAGPGYNNHRWRELVFAVRFGLAFKAAAPDEKRRLMLGAGAFSQWLDLIKESGLRQLRHMLLHLIFPDAFERVFGGGHRRLIVQKFRSLSASAVRKMTPLLVDIELQKIRAEQAAKFPDKELDFYFEPLRAQWNPNAFEEYTADIELDDVKHALAEIDATGVPASAESTHYDLIDGDRRYPPKLVLSLAAKHASGKEFDRTLFQGGVDSPAFKLLRDMGFPIERKEAIPELLTQFIAQATEATSTKVRGYLTHYRGLKVTVGFGAEQFEHVPWIAFTGYGQEVRSGIYPVFLYFRAAGVLILAKGVGDDSPQGMTWHGIGEQTVDAYFRETFGQRAIKHPELLVFRVYKVPLEVDLKTVNHDLDRLIAAYQVEAGKGSMSTGATYKSERPPTVLSVAEADDQAYSVSEAVEPLFVEQARFEEILAVWQQKKNLVLQGPPGVGKTFFYRQLAYALFESRSPSRITAVEFHPSYSYEDFVQGFRPIKGNFELRQGPFVRACERAREDLQRDHVFVIDEINRGNLAKIFGEALMLLEADKREEKYAVPLAYSAEEAKPFWVPPNLYVLGLMNTADRSLAVVDYALRRRFAFVNLEPAFASPKFAEHLKEKGIADNLTQKIVARMTELNGEIAKDRTNLGPGFRIGHSFFCSPPVEHGKHEDWYLQVIDTEIAPLLGEYYFDDPDAADKLIKKLRS